MRVMQDGKYTTEVPLREVPWFERLKSGASEIWLDQTGTDEFILWSVEVTEIMVFFPKIRFNPWLNFIPNLRRSTTKPKFLAAAKAIHSSIWEWLFTLNFFTKSPVLISTGQFTAQRPSTAQVSKPSNWNWLASKLYSSILFSQYPVCIYRQTEKQLHLFLFHKQKC